LIQTSALDHAPAGRAHNALGMSILEGSLHAVMIGVAESYLGAFAVELGHGPRAQGLLATLPLVLGAICQLSSPLFCAWFGSRKRVAVAGALGQTASMAGLIVIAMCQSTSFSALLAARVGFWVSGGLMAPAWNAWMADLTVNINRSRYFARRSALNHVALLIAFGAAGWALYHAGVRLMHCYLTLFVVAFFARLTSVGALLLQADVEPLRPRRALDPHWPRLGHALSRARVRVALYMACLAFGTQLSAPFFTPYMLRELSLDYKSFAGLSVLSILTKALAFPCCHHWAERLGQRSVLRWGGVGVAVIPLVWAVSSELPALIVAHVLGGAVWAAVESSSYQLLLESAPAEFTAEFFSLSSAATGVAQVGGALLGGLLLGSPHLDYRALFGLSALLRALPLALLFLAFRPDGLPLWLRWLYGRMRSFEALAGPAQADVLRISQVPRALGSRNTDPPPAL
jgi:MFS family permease